MKLQNLPSCPEGFHYTIKSGDTFYLLGKKFNISTQDIINANPNVDPRNLQIGQKICIPTQIISPKTCVLALKPNSDSPTLNANGLLWLKRNNSEVRLLIVGFDLPDPATLNATSYQATFVWGRTTFDLSLTKATLDGTEIWVGETAQSFPPEFFSGGVDIYPTPQGPPLIGGLIEDCTDTN